MKRKTKADLDAHVASLLKKPDIVTELNEPKSLIESAVGLSGAISRLEKRVAIIEGYIAPLVALGKKKAAK